MILKITQEQADNFDKAMAYFRDIPPDRIDQHKGSILKSEAWDYPMVCIGCHLSIIFEREEHTKAAYDPWVCEATNINDEVDIYSFTDWQDNEGALLREYFGVDMSVFKNCGAGGSRCDNVFVADPWHKPPYEVFKTVRELCEVIA